MDGRESQAKMDGERELGAWHPPLVEKPMDAMGPGEEGGEGEKRLHVAPTFGVIRGNYCPGGQLRV